MKSVKDDARADATGGHVMGITAIGGRSKKLALPAGLLYRIPTERFLEEAATPRLTRDTTPRRPRGRWFAAKGSLSGNDQALSCGGETTR